MQAMVEKDVVAIVEKVWRAKTEANMMALFPNIDVQNEPWVKKYFLQLFLFDYR